jgi:hypothetical protein
MAGKFNCTCNNGRKKRAGKSATIHMDQLKQKMAGKFYEHVRGGKMAGKFETMNLVYPQKIKWRENSTTPATTEVKEMSGKSATTWIS